MDIELQRILTSALARAFKEEETTELIRKQISISKMPLSDARGIVNDVLLKEITGRQVSECESNIRGKLKVVGTSSPVFPKGPPKEIYLQIDDNIYEYKIAKGS